MSASLPSASSLDWRRRRALFRAWHRGMREMDLLLGQFADAQIAELSEAELDDFEALMELPDHEVFGWLCSEATTPTGYDTPLFRKLKQFHAHDEPIGL